MTTTTASHTTDKKKNKITIDLVQGHVLLSGYVPRHVDEVILNGGQRDQSGGVAIEVKLPGSGRVRRFEDCLRLVSGGVEEGEREESGDGGGDGDGDGDAVGKGLQEQGGGQSAGCVDYVLLDLDFANLLTSSALLEDFLLKRTGTTRLSQIAHLPVILLIRNIEDFNKLSQGRLYELFDAFHYNNSAVGARVVAVTRGVGVEEVMEKRVRSRFLHRHIYFAPEGGNNVDGDGQTRSKQGISGQFTTVGSSMNRCMGKYLAATGLSTLELSILYALAVEETHISTAVRIERTLKQILPGLMATRKMIQLSLPRLEFMELVQTSRGVIRLGMCLLETGHPRQVVRQMAKDTELPTELEQFMQQ